MAGIPWLQSPSTSSKGDEQVHLGMGGHRELDYGVKESMLSRIQSLQCMVTWIEEVMLKIELPNWFDSNIYLNF